jgi:hypothetical protein
VATKRKPGAVIGRPKKPGAAKRGKGRPAKRLAEDPERYLKALVQAFMHRRDLGLAPAAATDNKIAEGLVTLRYGRPSETEENIAAMMRGERCEFWADPRQGHIRWAGDINSVSETTGKKWRDKNIFRAPTDNLSRDLRRIRTAPVADPCRRWLAAMTILWLICFNGEIASRLFAAQLAELIGEGEYFRNRMMPVLARCAAMREAGLRGFTPPFSWLVQIVRPVTGNLSR